MGQVIDLFKRALKGDAPAPSSTRQGLPAPTNTDVSVQNAVNVLAEKRKEKERMLKEAGTK